MFHLWHTDFQSCIFQAASPVLQSLFCPLPRFTTDDKIVGKQHSPRRVLLYILGHDSLDPDKQLHTECGALVWSTVLSAFKFKEFVEDHSFVCFRPVAWLTRSKYHNFYLWYRTISQSRIHQPWSHPHKWARGVVPVLYIGDWLLWVVNTKNSFCKNSTHWDILLKNLVANAIKLVLKPYIIILSVTLEGYRRIYC